MINSYKNTTFLQSPQIAGMMPNDNGVEFIGVRQTKQVIWLQNGNSHYFSDLPYDYYMLLKDAYTNDDKAVAFLSSVTADLNRQIELYTYYMYGAIDATPDIVDGKLSHCENFRDKRDCPSLHWNSKSLKIGEHTLTPRQIVIIDLISNDIPDKAIADTLCVTHSTLDFHKRNLYQAIGVSSKIGLFKLCVKHKIIN